MDFFFPSKSLHKNKQPEQTARAKIQCEVYLKNLCECSALTGTEVQTHHQGLMEQLQQDQSGVRRPLWTHISSKSVPNPSVQDAVCDLEVLKGAGRMREGFLSIFLSRVRAPKLRIFLSHCVEHSGFRGICDVTVHVWGLRLFKLCVR